jgi:hypothetical protein
MDGLVLAGAVVFAMLTLSSMHVLIRQLDNHTKRQAEIIALLTEIRDSVKGK